VAKKTRKSKKDRIFNNRPRKLFRKYIPTSEVVFSAGFVGVVILMGAWFAAQKENYDPSERDISMELMIAGQTEDNLYRTPLQRWVDPSKAAAGGGAPSFDLGVFPDTMLDGGWTPASRYQVFEPETMFEKINGAAPQYINFGAEYLHYIAIADPTGAHELSIELYDMVAFENALGIFGAQRDRSRTIDEMRNVYYYPTEVGALGIFERYYVKIVGTSDDRVVKDKTTEVLAKLSQAPGLESAVIPRFFTVFNEALGIPFQDITYLKNDAFQYGFAKEFWFGVIPDGGEARYYAHEAASPEEALTLFQKLKENQAFDYEIVSESDREVVMKHKFLDSYLALNRIDNMVYGVDGAAATEDLDDWLIALEGYLLNGEEA